MTIQDIIQSAALPEEIKDFLIDNSDPIQETLNEVERKIQSMDIETIKEVIKERINPLCDIDTNFIFSLSVSEAFKFEEWNGLINNDVEWLNYNELSYEYVRVIDDKIEHYKVEEYLSSLLTQEHYEAVELMEGI